MPDNHLSPAALWEHRSREIPLSSEEMEHLSKCTDCLSMLGLCQISKSLEQAQRLVREHFTKE